VELHVDIPEPPSLLDILVADSAGIVDALELVLETAKSASLGPKGIVTTFPVPYAKDTIQNALSAGDCDNVLAVARRALVRYHAR
jgi:hypothetical protein